ncbi:hypothetical protein GF336_04760 [Candidatus Woesearchaeota archaeon]|nr:hypothetical protein [Candidatus Woesearchaeota archaeon]
MIRKSFIFLERIGKKKEENIWKQAGSWDDFLKTSEIKGIENSRKKNYNRRILEARKSLYDLDSSYFIGKLPQPEMWRLYDFFKDESVFLDIEVDNVRGDVIVVGLFDGIDTKTMIKGINLDFNILEEELRKYKLIVTFNGAVFDVPFLKKRYPRLLPDVPVFDLRVLCSRLGYKGGLKQIEKEFGIKRNKIVEEIYSGDPYLLYRMFRGSGDKDYLDLLVEYNEEDVINLKAIADKCFKMMEKKFKEKYIV